MPVCDLCGNDNDKAFTLSRAGKTWTFDSFECAIALAAPRCAHCARHQGATEVKDRA